jgi:hypothetical protein
VRGVLDRIRFWNVTAEERLATHPADRHVPAGGGHLLRAVDVDADPAVVYRWLCQIAVAPYSYDLVDNLGRRSPTTLTPGAGDVRLGQWFQIGPVVEVEPGRQITVATAGRAARVFGNVAITWQVVPGVTARSRILGCVALGPARGPLDRAWQELLAAGDLVMMRRQLLNLKELAEATQPG